MKTPIRCSVIIPTRNCREYLGLALASVRLQGIDDLETIVVDDGSTDGTDEFLAHEARSDPRLVVITLDGRGPSVARNAALARANGRFIAFLDADDFWWPGKLGPQLQHFEQRPDLAFSFTDYMHVTEDGRALGACFDYWRPTYVDRNSSAYRRVEDAEFEILGANVVGTSVVVASARALQIANGFPATSQSAEDWCLWLQLAKIGEVACSSAITMNYLMRVGSVTQNRRARIDSMRDIVRPYGDRAEPPARRAYRRATARIHTAEAERHRLLGSPARAAAAHLRALACWPEGRTARALIADIARTLSPRSH